MNQQEIHSPEDWTSNILGIFENNSSSDASAMQAYMKNKFPFFGIKKPLRAELQKKYYEEAGIPGAGNFREVACILWDQPQREAHYLAMDVLYRNRRHLIEEDIFMLEEFMRTNAWWDSIDFISPKLAQYWMLKYPSKKEETLFKWNADKDFWVRRASLIAQLHLNKNIDCGLQFRLIVPQLQDKEFFIRKAIGWSLREMAKSYPELVIDFVNQHDMSPLSKKEALKHLPHAR